MANQTITNTSPDLAAGQKCEVSSGDGAISITRGREFITKGSAAALTLALPVAGQDDGKTLDVISTTAFAHTVTTPAGGLNGTLHIFTFAGFAGNTLALRAYNGSWWVPTTTSGTAGGSGTLS